MPEFTYTDLLPLGPDAAEYRLLTEGGIRRRVSFGKEFLEVEPGVLSMLSRQAMRDIAQSAVGGSTAGRLPHRGAHVRRG